MVAASIRCVNCPNVQPMTDVIRKFLNKFRPQPSPKVITFTGGMGAQIISAAIYYSLRDSGEKVLADLSYFVQTPRIASPGRPGDCSFWPWQLDDFGISQQSFENVLSTNGSNLHYIHDGELKLQLGIGALSQTSIQVRFPVPPKLNYLLPVDFPKDFLCLHIRRGDYLNVASHLVGDEQFAGIAKKFSKLLQGLVVLSDSPISADFKATMVPFFTQVAWMEELDTLQSHCLMRQARVLVCSNSQFSLTAGLLNNKGLVIFPRKWFGPGNEKIEKTLSNHCDFQILGGF